MVVLIIRTILCPVHRLILLDEEDVHYKKNEFRLVKNDVYQSKHSNMPNDGERILIVILAYRVHLIDKENVHFKKKKTVCSWVKGELNYQTFTIDSNKTASIMTWKIQARKLDMVENENDVD